jgi:hypothetical protein
MRIATLPQRRKKGLAHRRSMNAQVRDSDVLDGAACRLLAHPIVPLNWGNAIRPPQPAGHQAATRSPVQSIVYSGHGHPAWSPWHAAANRGIQALADSLRYRETG